MSPVELESVLTCPLCGVSTRETMPTNACRWFHACAACHGIVQPLPGDCCVYCSYGTAKYPPVQPGMSCCTGGGCHGVRADAARLGWQDGRAAGRGQGVTAVLHWGDALT